jgi:hypothetical protein
MDVLVSIAVDDFGLRLPRSVPVAFVVAACVQHKLITRIGNFLHVTPKYGDESLYSPEE